MLVVNLKQLTKEDVSIAGGKAANLGELLKIGMPVPQGFVITAKAYFEFLEKNNIKEKIIKIANSIDVDNTQELERKTAKIRELIRKSNMGELLIEKIEKAYKEICKEEAVAVRSSATAEDLPTASFAGQQETYLNVKGIEELINAVKNCWASLFTPRATYYRKKQGFPTEKIGIAVVVQKMVRSEVSGVMFSTDPTGMENILTIEAIFGLGEPIVQGEITPDTYYVDKNKLQIVKKIVRAQEWMLVSKTHGNERKPIKKENQRKQKLEDSKILELAKLGLEIEKHYGKGQDIEWALEEGKLYIVQSRAITAYAKKRHTKIKAKPILSGIGASPGVVSAKARIILDAKDAEKLQKDEILVTRMTNPDWVPIMKKSKAIVTDEGGKTCHAAIVSRELGIPCIVGTEAATKKIKDGQIITVDGYEGKIYKGEIKIERSREEEERLIKKFEIDKLEKAIAAAHNLKKETQEIAAKIVAEFGKKPAAEMSEKELKKETEELLEFLEAIAPKVKVNVALPEAAKRAAETNAAGVGLLRAEHMITASGIHPAEYIRQNRQEELVQAVKKGIRTVVEAFKGKPVWYRTFDARTDEFRELKGGELEPREANPMLGWHGIRRDLDEPELLKAQFRAIKELIEEGYTNIGVMLPFVSNATEVKKAKEIAIELGLDPDNKKPLFGVMIETPAAALTIDELIKEGIDFISFGTNDLTQLTLGVDRNNERIQKLFDETHPAVLRQIKHVIEKCKKAKIETSICGQAANNPKMVRKLVEFGIDSISANIDAVERIKRIVIEEQKRILLRKSKP
ncbi:MAG: phosphoenolpyruvate synthase [Candidatus Diapherotrites archaeon]|nr:phosphoenolpyruvate synthase [Candidatus Diapherotrites archaeon]